jgi:membrane-associated protease RseP (regulator of RpoE activity)
MTLTQWMVPVPWLIVLAITTASGISVAHASEFSPERFGIGASLGQADSMAATTVRWVSPGGPAEDAGLLPGDTLIAVDEQSILGWPLAKILDRLITDAARPVYVTIARDSQRLSMLVERRRFSEIAAAQGTRWTVSADSTWNLEPAQAARPWIRGEPAASIVVASSTCDTLALSWPSSGLTFVYCWAGWCNPCKQLINLLKQSPLDQQIERIRVIGINFDQDCGAFRSSVESIHPPGSQYWARGWKSEAAQRFRTYRRGIPTGALLDADGKVLKVTSGTDSLVAMLKDTGKGK